MSKQAAIIRLNEIVKTCDDAPHAVSGPLARIVVDVHNAQINETNLCRILSLAHEAIRALEDVT